MRLVCLTIFWLGLSLAGPGISAQQARELVFLTWADYISPEVASEFESECQCRLRTV